jgi:hypothetical protein
MTLVRMEHPQLDHPGDLPVTTRQAFEDVWKAKGWKLVQGDESSAPAAGDEVPAPGEPEPTKKKG